MSQEFNSAQIAELQASYLSRNDLINRWGNLVSSYLALPGLRFFAPLSLVGATGGAVDLVFGNNLGNNNNALFGYDRLIPYCQYNGTTQYHNVADTAAHDIIGNEAYINSVVRGLTIGMWVYPLALPGATTRLLAKGTTTGNARAYALLQGATNVFTFQVSDNGTNAFNVADDTAFAADTWYFIAGRFNPSTEVELFRGNASGLTSFSNTT